MASNPYAYGRLTDVIDQAIADTAATLAALDASCIATRVAGYPGRVSVAVDGGDTQTVNPLVTELGTDYTRWCDAIVAAGTAAFESIP